MTKHALLVALISLPLSLAAGVGVVGCDGGGGDGDGDADVDADADADADGDCGELDETCCATEPGCMGDLVCAARSGEGATCHEACDPGLCSYGDRDGYCVEGGGGGVCAVTDAESIYCDFDGCETPYGVSEETRCVQDPETWETFCFESCELQPTGCDEATHVCVALAEGGGVCRPL